MWNFRRIMSLLLVLCMFVQIPFYTGAETQLTGHESGQETESELMDVTDYPNSYLSLDDYGTSVISVPSSQSSDEDLYLPEKYDSREKGYVTSVKNQGPYGTCWAHAAMSAAETSVLMKGLYKEEEEPDFSEMHYAYSYYNRKNDPLGNTEGDKNISLGTNWLARGANSICSAMYLAQWTDPIKEEDAPYWRIPFEGDEYGPAEYKLQNAVFVPSRDIDAIKKCIMKYGSVSATYYSDYSEYDENCLYYNNIVADLNHAINIVGWDDTIKKEDFKGEYKPSDDGVWIVKNSWGERGPYNGYFYMSQSQYLADVVAYEYMNSNEYDYNYFYDGSNDYFSTLYANDLQVANIYEAKKGESTLGEYIKGVSVNIASNKTDCEIQVYTNIKDDSNPTSGTPMLTSPARICTDYGGVYTVPLGELVEIEKGTKFSVVVTAKTRNNSLASVFVSRSVAYPSLVESQEHTDPNQSFVSVSNSWKDLHGYQGNYRCANVKALTVLEDRDEQSAKKSISEASVTLEKTEYTYSGNECKPKVSDVTVDGKKLTESVDYEVSYFNNTEAGDATVRIVGINNYTGVKEIPFKITGLSLTEDMVDSIEEDHIYTASSIRPTVTVKNDTKTLQLNSDYTVTYTDNINVGTAKVSICGINNYTGCVELTFNILPYILTESMMNSIAPQEYTGKKIEPIVTVRYNNKALINGTDYTVSYGENVDIGTGTVMITGKGNFVGSFTKQFKIEKRETRSYTLKSSAQAGGSITPTGEISVEEGKDLTFNIVANEGYQIKDVIVDRKNVGNVSEYTFTSVNNNHKIEASFAPIKVESIKLVDNEISLKEGESYIINAIVEPVGAKDKSLSWESSNTDVVTVENGVLTAVKSGKSVITANSVDGSDISATCNVTVTEVNSIDDPTNLSPKTTDNSTKSPSKILPVIETTRSAEVVKKDKYAAKKAMKQAKITKLTVKSKAKKKITVKWKKVDKAKGYEVQVSNKKNFKKVIYDKLTSKKKLTIKNSKIKSKKTYYIRVRAYATYKDKNGVAKKVYSSWIKKVRKIK